MPSEYDPLFTETRAGENDLEPVRERFRAASRPFLRSPWSWFAWALLLPAVALATPRVLAAAGPPGVLIAWSVTILLGGAVEMTGIRRGRRSRGEQGGSTPLAAWVLRIQGNLSLVALALSALFLWQDLAWAIPGLWLLLLGHSLYVLGGLAFDPFRVCGIVYQVGGLVALWPGGAPLAAFALATAAGNLWMGLAVLRERGVG
jgi:hypothetical protein